MKIDTQNSALSSGCSKDLSKKIVGCLGKPKKCNFKRGSSKKSRVEDPDMLNALPLEIQMQIFSILQTTDAARLGFASTTWRTRWNSISKLIFKYDQFPGAYRSSRTARHDAFVRYIDHALTCHDESDVHVFELWLWPDIFYSISIYIRWIRFAIKHNVQKLVLFGKMATNGKIPHCVFSCRSIVKLELAIERYFLTWPETCALPNLRKLKLKFLVFDEASLRDLFKSCPVLEKLSICFCYVGSFKTLLVTAPKLTEFMMCNCPGMGACSLSIQTATLSKFIYITPEPSQIMLVPTQSIGLIISEERVSVKYKSTDHLSSSVLKVTRELFKAKFVVFHSWLFQSLSMVKNLPRQLEGDEFCNVERLLINLHAEMIHVKTALLLISRCAFLSILYLELEGSTRETVELPDLDMELTDLGSRRCFHRLSAITIRNFGGSDVELTLVKLLLANAHKLHVMGIEMNMAMLRSNTMKEKIETILAYEKASPVANVNFD